MTHILNVIDHNRFESIIKKFVEGRDMSILGLLLMYNRNVDQPQPRYINHKYPIPGYRFTSVHTDHYKPKNRVYQ